MTVRREAINAGDRELRWTARRFGDDFRELRLRAGVSQAAVARSIGVDRSVVTRLERGDATVGNPIRARAAACLGADFRLQIYSQRAPMIFDAAHARVIERLLSAAHSRWHPVVEAPVPGPGRRSVDVQLEDGDDMILIEVETRVRRLEETIRALHGSRASVSSRPDVRVHSVLILPPTRHHRSLVLAHRATIAAAFPVRSAALAACLRSAAGGWPGDGILFIAGG